MSEPIEVAIQVAMFAHLKASDSSVKDIPRAAPFVVPPYPPVTGTLYLDVQFLRAEPEHFGIAIENSDILTGIMQVTVVAPLGSGEHPGLRVAALVRDWFDPKNLTGANRLTANGRWIDVAAPPAIATAVKDAPWVRFPVSIRFQLIA